MNLHRDASSGKQNFPNNNISTCKSLFCLGKKLFFSCAESLLKVSTKRMIIDAISFLEEIVIKKSYLKIHKRAKWLVLFFNTMNQLLIEKRNKTSFKIDGRLCLNLASKRAAAVFTTYNPRAKK